MALQIAATSVDLTPAKPVPLAGAGSTIPFSSVESSLEANAISFRNAAGRCAVILSLDTLFVGGSAHAALEHHFTGVHRQRASDLLIVATHTHYAPGLDETKQRLGAVDRDYLSLVVDRCKSLIDRVLGAVHRTGELDRRCGTSDAAVNRRNRWPLPYVAGRRGLRVEAAMAPNPRGPIDKTITVWTVRDMDGDAPIAIIWHYTCHPTGFPQSAHVTPEYPGIVRAHLRRHFDSSIPVLFLQGFAGDIRPNAPETRSLLTRIPRALVFGPSFDRFSGKGWQHWAENLAKDVVEIVDGEDASSNPGHRSSFDEILSASYSVALSELVDGNNAEKKVGFQRLCVSRDLDIFAVAAEPLVGLRKFLPAAVTPVGYLGDVFGYWPTDDDARYGGYEVRGYFKGFGLKGRLRTSLDDVFRSAVGKLALS